MQYFRVLKPKNEWKILRRTKRTQVAIMRIPAGETEGGPNNRHMKSDQWLYVLSGKGKAKVGRKSVILSKGSLLLIEAGEAHEISAGKSALTTINFYGPPVMFSESNE